METEGFLHLCVWLQHIHLHDQAVLEPVAMASFRVNSRPETHVWLQHVHSRDHSASELVTMADAGVGEKLAGVYVAHHLMDVYRDAAV